MDSVAPGKGSASDDRDSGAATPILDDDSDNDEDEGIITKLAHSMFGRNADTVSKDEDTAGSNTKDVGETKGIAGRHTDHLIAAA